MSADAAYELCSRLLEETRAEIRQDRETKATSVHVADVEGDGDFELIAVGIGFNVSESRLWLLPVDSSVVVPGVTRADWPKDRRDARNTGCYCEVDNHPPMADAGLDQEAECTSVDGAWLTLDGSDSIDVDSTPGTHDDITSFVSASAGAEIAARSVAVARLKPANLSPRLFFIKASSIRRRDAGFC